MEPPIEEIRSGRPRILALCEAGPQWEAAAYGLSTLLEIAGARVELRRYGPDDTAAGDTVDAVVSYGAHPPRVSKQPQLHIQASGFFGPERYFKRDSVPVQRYDHDGISALYSAAESTAPVLSRLGDAALILNLDVVASTFVLLTCYQEVVTSGSIDKRGRRSAEESFQLRLELIDRPIVNEYARYVCSVLEDLEASISFEAPKWGTGEYAFAVTRDIDSNQKHCKLSLQRLASMAARGDLLGIARTIRSGITTRNGIRNDPYNNIAAIRTWEQAAGIRSSLYMLSSDIVGDANYKLSELAHEWDVTSLIEQGWEIGFHPGFRTYADGEAFREEKVRFDDSIPGKKAGGRQHGLRFIAPHTWRHWEDCRFRYDSTMGFAEREGFRCGVCVPFRPFDVLENRTMDLWEIPLTLMDSTITKYRHFDAGQTRNAAGAILEQVRKHHGIFVLLWHNTTFGRENAGWLHDEFADLVTRAVNDGALVAPARDLLDVWEGWVNG